MAFLGKAVEPNPGYLKPKGNWRKDCGKAGTSDLENRKAPGLLQGSRHPFRSQSSTLVEGSGQ